jgi:hypothetical protein
MAGVKAVLDPVALRKRGRSVQQCNRGRVVECVGD